MNAVLVMRVFLDNNELIIIGFNDKGLIGIMQYFLLFKMVLRK